MTLVEICINVILLSITTVVATASLLFVYGIIMIVLNKDVS
jgi:hypothetical protein